ncbi:hypothetical protein QL285_061775 [Trifolium repens]|nr:hypothetical protein QL285_061775 [Trifolium repens]
MEECVNSYVDQELIEREVRSKVQVVLKMQEDQTIRCGNCKEFGHNILDCQRDKTKKQKQLKSQRKKNRSGANANMQEATVESHLGAASQDHSGNSHVRILTDTREEDKTILM